MAYDVTEERLKVKGSEQITRDLKVDRDAYINGSLNTSGDIDIQGQVIARDDVSISGDLYVNGTEYINNSETSQTSDNYLVLRHNKTTALGSNEHAGIAVHNYSPNKTATCTVDNQGTWRVADNTETSTVYTNVSYFNGVYYAGLTTTTTTVADGIKTVWDEDELDECVYYSTSYYHLDGNNWFPVSLVDNKLTLGSVITDSTIIAALNALTREDLTYFRSLTVTVINPVENQPLLTRDEATNLQNKDLLTWDSTAQKAVAAPRATADDQSLVWKSGNYEWKGITDTVESGNSDLVTSGAVYDALQNTIQMQVVFDVSHPVGETYTQYPEQLDPVSLYNQNGIQSTWTLLDFGGAFFRAEGGNALAFNNSKEVTAVSGAVLTIPSSGASVGCLVYDPVGNETRTVTAVSGNNVTVDSAFTSTDLTSVLIGQSGQNAYHNHTMAHTHGFTPSGSVSVKTNPTFTGNPHSHISGLRAKAATGATSSIYGAITVTSGSSLLFTTTNTSSSSPITQGITAGGSISGGSYKFTGTSSTTGDASTSNTSYNGSSTDTEARPVNMTVRVWKRTD